jgi:charged multivesicular body protein 6
VDGLKRGNDVLRRLNDEMSIDKVQRLMDDTADSIAYQRVPQMAFDCD